MPGKCELDHIARSICDFNKCEYMHFIDSGAFKETYQIQKDNKYYALKIFKINNSSERTEREIDAMQRVNCVHIAKLIKVDTFPSADGAFLYLFEEYLAGGSLGTQIKIAPLSRAEIISIGDDLINSLEATYDEHIVHRDIKPDNIMFRGNRNDAVLIDFGLVRDLDATSLTKAFFMRGPGTALYSAPEQLNNNKALIDWRTDQFALGITLYEAMFKSHPFNAGTPYKTVELIASMNRCHESIAQRIIDVGLDPLIKMLEPYPINRYRTPNHLKSAWHELEGK